MKIERLATNIMRTLVVICISSLILLTSSQGKPISIDNVKRVAAAYSAAVEDRDYQAAADLCHPEQKV